MDHSLWLQLDLWLRNYNILHVHPEKKKILQNKNRLRFLKPNLCLPEGKCGEREKII